MIFYAILLSLILLMWYYKSSQHPKNYPQGPRLPLVLLGLSGDFANDMKKISNKYGDGNLCGFWLGPFRAVTVKKFETIHSLLNHPKVEGRQKIASKCKILIVLWLN